MDDRIKQRHAKLLEDFEERGQEVFDELREEDPETYALVLAEGMMQLEDASEWEDDEESNESVQPDESRDLTFYKRDGESDEQATARYWMKPELLAADSLNLLTRFGGERGHLNELMVELESQTKELGKGRSDRAESMLSAQAHTLDAMFHNLIKRAMANVNGGYSETGRDYLKLAMRAQSQCRSTLDSVTAMNRPVIKQTNIAHGHQQVNNNPPNELLEEQNEWLDTGAAQTASKDDQKVEAVGEIDGTENT